MTTIGGGSAVAVTPALVGQLPPHSFKKRRGS
jgi:hypothetical protein